MYKSAKLLGPRESPRSCNSNVTSTDVYLISKCPPVCHDIGISSKSLANESESSKQAMV